MCPTLSTPWTVAYQAPPSMGFSRQECWSGLPFDPSSISRSGRSPGEGTSYALQRSCASPVAQRVKNLPAMGETWARALGWEDPLEKGMATHSSILAWRIPWTVESTGSQTVKIQLSNFHFHFSTGVKATWVLFVLFLTTA